MPATFIPGLELSERFYREAVAPLLQRYFPAVQYDAARLGSGSEVLGFDTVRSADHEWGPRLQLFLSRDDASASTVPITEMLADRLPKVFRGYPTNFTSTGDGDIRSMQRTEGPVHHRIDVTESAVWLRAHLGFDPNRAVSNLDWLATPWQRLLEVTAGAVFRAELGTVSRARQLLAWYPDDIWRYVLAAQWQRIAAEDAFPGRCAEVDDELGSAVVTARLVRDLMRLCLLLARRYPPYSKWLGSAFRELPGVVGIATSLSAAQCASDWPRREQHLVGAYEAVAARHGTTTVDSPRSSRPAPAATSTARFASSTPAASPLPCARVSATMP